MQQELPKFLKSLQLLCIPDSQFNQGKDWSIPTKYPQQSQTFCDVGVNEKPPVPVESRSFSSQPSLTRADPLLDSPERFLRRDPDTWAWIFHSNHCRHREFFLSETHSPLLQQNLEFLKTPQQMQPSFKREDFHL